MKRTCDGLGVCNGHGNCPGCVRPAVDKDRAPVDGGNFWLKPGPEQEPTTASGAASTFLMLLFIAAGCSGLVGFIAGLAWGRLGQ